MSDLTSFDDDLTPANDDTTEDPRTSESHPGHGQWLVEQSWSDVRTEQAKAQAETGSADLDAGTAALKAAADAEERAHALAEAGRQGATSYEAQEAFTEQAAAQATDLDSFYAELDQAGAVGGRQAEGRFNAANFGSASDVIDLDPATG